MTTDATTVASAVRKYRWQFSGMVAHVIQRATGVALLFYLLLHVRTIRQLREGPAAFDAALATFRTPVFKLLEIGLLATVVLHAMNGIRLTMLDLGYGHDRQRQLFWYWAVGIGALVFLAGALPMFLWAVLKLPTP